MYDDGEGQLVGERELCGEKRALGGGRLRRVMEIQSYLADGCAGVHGVLAANLGQSFIWREPGLVAVCAEREADRVGSHGLRLGGGRVQLRAAAYGHEPRHPCLLRPRERAFRLVLLGAEVRVCIVENHASIIPCCRIAYFPLTKSRRLGSSNVLPEWPTPGMSWNDTCFAQPGNALMYSWKLRKRS